MQHKSLGEMQCPIARSLERVGEWWSILILRDAFLGLTRFDEFQKSLGIAPNMLTRRLNTLVESGLLERRLYSERPPRYEYVLTPRGHDFRTVLWALVAWGNKHFAPEGESAIVVDAATGERAEPVLVDKRSGRVMRSPEFAVAAGPAANEETRQRYARAKALRTEGKLAVSEQSNYNTERAHDGGAESRTLANRGARVPKPNFSAGHNPAGDEKSPGGQNTVGSQQAAGRHSPVRSQKSAGSQNPAGTQKSAGSQNPAGTQKSAGSQDPAGTQNSAGRRKKSGVK
jgi:DNA-binding HxlR family transcriptional regulator